MGLPLLNSTLVCLNWVRNVIMEYCTSDSILRVSLHTSLHVTMRVAMCPVAELKCNSVIVSIFVEKVEKSSFFPASL